MVNNVFDFTEIETDKLEIQPSPMNLRELLSEIFMIFRQTAEGRNLKLELILPEHMPRVVLDPQRLRQVLLNLVGRAVRSVRDGSVVISAKFVMAEAASGHGELAVRIIAAGNAVECALVTGRFGGAGRPDSNTSFRSGSAAGWAAASNARAAPAGAVRSPSFSGNCRACRPHRRKRWSRRSPAGRGTTVFFSWMMFR